MTLIDLDDFAKEPGNGKSACLKIMSKWAEKHEVVVDLSQYEVIINIKENKARIVKK